MLEMRNDRNNFRQGMLAKPPKSSGSSFQPEGYTEELCANSSFTCGKAHLGRLKT